MCDNYVTLILSFALSKQGTNSFLCTFTGYVGYLNWESVFTLYEAPEKPTYLMKYTF